MGTINSHVGIMFRQSGADAPLHYPPWGTDVFVPGSFFIKGEGRGKGEEKPLPTVWFGF